MKYLLTVLLAIVFIGCEMKTINVSVGDANWEDGGAVNIVEGPVGPSFLIAGQKCPTGYFLVKEYINTDSNKAILIIRCN